MRLDIFYGLSEEEQQRLISDINAPEMSVGYAEKHGYTQPVGSEFHRMSDGRGWFIKIPAEQTGEICAGGDLPETETFSEKTERKPKQVVWVVVGLDTIRVFSDKVAALENANYWNIRLLDKLVCKEVTVDE